MYAVARRGVVAVSYFLCAVVTSNAVAQAYPDKPIRLVVGSATGGGTDFVARVTSPKLADLLGKQVVIDNRGGAGGVVAADVVAHATPDGYTLLLMATNLAILPSLHRKVPFDVSRDLAPVVRTVSYGLMLVVNAASPAKTVPELVALAHNTKGGINYSAAGIGSLGHLAAELLKVTTKAPMEHVAYKGGGPAMAALIGNEVQFNFATLPGALAHMRAGRLRGLGVTSAKRSAAAPNVPTVADQGLPGFEVTGWVGLLAPAKTPSDVIQLLNAKSNEVLKSPEITERLVNDGMDPSGGTPKEFGTQVRNDLKKWSAVIRQAGILRE